MGYKWLVAQVVLVLTVIGVGIASENIASLGVPSQIDDWNLYTTADKAIDGNRNGYWRNDHANSVQVTRSFGGHVWWKLTFPTSVLINKIVVYNRQDCCQWRINGQRIMVDDKYVATLTPHTAQAYEVGDLNIVGKVITIYGSNIINDGYLDMAEVEVYGIPEDVKCYDSSGKEYRGGDSYEQKDGKTCTCGIRGLICKCEGEDISCPAGSYKWTDQVSCQAKCIKQAAYCASTGDPHYRSFDGKYFDFHGDCTYQAASCDDFVVNFKNKDFYGRAPRYTLRAELVFKGATFSIANKYQALVNGQAVQVPFIKTYKNGDRVEIVNNGQLEIRLIQASKDRMPAVRIRATNAVHNGNSYIQAELWLHGSCSDVTEGLCGNWNGNPNDDLTGGSANSLGQLHQKYDENCPAPPDPYHPCDDVPNGHEDAAAICDDLKGAPFTSCHTSVSYGDNDGGIYHNCMTDVCNCFGDRSCACSQYDNYASSCIEANIDLSNWRQSVDYCPYDCPEGLTYMAAGAVPAPTCLEQEPEQEGTVRGCFCPNKQFLQDGVCVSGDKCRCLYEGKFYEPGDVIKKEGECQECTCKGAGQMSCSSLSCPALSCASDQIVASRDDMCCPYCESNWVEALNPEETVKEGQDVVLTCQVNAGEVTKEDITWSKDGKEIPQGVSEDGRTLKISGAAEEDDGTYTCTANKGEAQSGAEFKVTVVLAPVPEENITFNPKKSNVGCKIKRKCLVSFKISQKDGGVVNKKSVQICKLVDGKLNNCKKVSYKKKKQTYTSKIAKKSTASTAGEYVCVVTLDGKKSVSDPVTVSVK